MNGVKLTHGRERADASNEALIHAALDEESSKIVQTGKILPEDPLGPPMEVKLVGEDESVGMSRNEKVVGSGKV